MSRKNRALAAKAITARRQAGELARVEFAKPFYQGYHDGVGINREALNAMVQAFNGPVKVIKEGRAVTSAGKAAPKTSDHRKRCGCDPRTVRQGHYDYNPAVRAADYRASGLYQGGSRLIRNGQVVS